MFNIFEQQREKDRREGNISAKNILQEIYQAKGLALPDYLTSYAGDRSPGWQSTAVLADGPRFTGAICSTNVAAEISAATRALDAIRPVVVYIDGTAMPDVIPLIHQMVLPSNVTVLLFTSIYPPIAECKNVITVILSDVTRNEPVASRLSQVAMAWDIAHSLTLKKRVGAKYVIVSDATTSRFLVDRINSWSTKNLAVAVSTVEQLERELPY